MLNAVKNTQDVNLATIRLPSRYYSLFCDKAQFVAYAKMNNVSLKRKFIDAVSRIHIQAGFAHVYGKPGVDK